MKVAIIKGQRCKIINGQIVPSVKGRPKGTGRYGEPTERRRIPLSLIPVVDDLLEKRQRVVSLRNELKRLEG
jgi:hypothetical protein